MGVGRRYQLEDRNTSGARIPSRGHVLRQGMALGPLREAAEGVGEAKVAELHQTAGVQENVGWLGKRGGLRANMGGGLRTLGWGCGPWSSVDRAWAAPSGPGG